MDENSKRTYILVAVAVVVAILAIFMFTGGGDDVPLVGTDEPSTGQGG